LKKWRDEKVIKVVTSLRRCGKSTLLNMFQQYLLENGVPSKRIISINFEAIEYESLLTTGRCISTSSKGFNQMS